MFPYGDTDDDQEDENSNEMDKDLHLMEHPNQSGTIDQIDSVLMRHDLGTYLIGKLSILFRFHGKSISCMFWMNFYFKSKYVNAI